MMYLLRKTCVMVIALLAVYSSQTVSAALVVNGLTGNTEYDGWVNLKAGTLTVTDLTNGFGSNEAGSGDAVFTRTSGGHFPAGVSLYSFSTPSMFEIADTSALSDVNTVVFSILTWTNPDPLVGDDGNPYTPAGAINAGPTLNFNGGAQALSADYIGASYYGAIDFGGPVDTYVYTFQWDLTSQGATITSYDVDWGQVVHTGVIALQLESADVFTQSAATVPEPSAFALFGLVLSGLVAIRRRS